jgi:glycosyltransferase involved in cell wall biosynthesis
VRSEDNVHLAGDCAPGRPGRTFGVLSTYPPTPCGVATFSAALAEGLASSGVRVRVVRVGDPGAGTTGRVVAQLADDEPVPAPAAVDALNDADVVIVQHEYGLYAGLDGESVVGVLESLAVPSIVVAHTVLQDPTPHQRTVLEAVVDAADAVVVMTEAGGERLRAGFDVDPDKIQVIPHGAAVAPVDDGPGPSSDELLTWGLLGPGKGIEWAIDALPLLRDVRPRVRYRIAGNTHPKVAAIDGDAYRDMLRCRAALNGVADDVTFDAGYRDLRSLGALISEAAIVVLPYDSPDQVTSGVLVDAIAAGRPVVATAFPHAEELLASGAGIVVPRRDPRALAAAVRRVLTEPELADAMAAEARRIAPALAWPAVGARYAALGEALLARRIAVSV